MAWFSYPFDNSYITSEEQWEEWHRHTYGIPDGVKAGVYGEFEVTPASSGLVVNVAGGVAIVRGFYGRNDAAESLTLNPPDTTNPRIDLVVLRMSKADNGFSRTVITGTPAASPTAPAPVQDGTTWDLPLAEVHVAANATSLSAGDITDRRVWTSGLDEHIDDTSNPHQVTAVQVGAAPVAHTHALGNLSDVDVAGAEDGDVLTLSAGGWVGAKGIPTGAILPYGGNTAPPGYLMCNGAAVSRTTYANLYHVIGTAFGSGNGSTTFNVPDLRGLFLRGSDGGVGRDPDRASRVALHSGGATGDAVGSYQGDQFRRHNHGISKGAGAANGNGAKEAGTGTSDTSTYAGGNETRPKNVYVNFIIKT